MDQKMRDAFAFGQARGKALVAQRRGAPRAAAARSFAGYLIAEGDSWFNYPIFDEITEKLEDDHGYRIESAARWGDTADNILYTQGGDGKKLVKVFEKVKSDQHVPRAILLSCGGNDIAGDRFIQLLNHKLSPQPGLNQPIVDAVFTRLGATVAGVVGLLKQLGTEHFSRDVPVVLHGYGRPVPDGRGFLDSSWFSGPWLGPAFEEKGYSALADRVQIMAALIDRFNTVMQSIAGGVPNVALVDARPALSNDLASERYKRDWSNELHPTGDGFGAVARLFDTAIRTFPMP
jgi:hypothetical protein